MADNALRGSLFGGFRRSDVISYIESTAAEYRERTDALVKENERLAKESEASAAEAEQLRAESDAAKAEIERLSPLLEQLQSEVAALREEVIPLRREKAELQEQNASLRVCADEYAATKLHLTEIELNARQHADLMIRDAQTKVADTYQACREKCSAVLTALDSTCVGAEEALRQTSQAVSALPEMIRSLREQLDEMQK